MGKKILVCKNCTPNRKCSKLCILDRLPHTALEQDGKAIDQGGGVFIGMVLKPFGGKAGDGVAMEINDQLALLLVHLLARRKIIKEIAERIGQNFFDKFSDLLTFGGMEKVADGSAVLSDLPCQQ